MKLILPDIIKLINTEKIVWTCALNYRPSASKFERYTPPTQTIVSAYGPNDRPVLLSFLNEQGKIVKSREIIYSRTHSYYIYDNKQECVERYLELCAKTKIDIKAYNIEQSRLCDKMYDRLLEMEKVFK